MTTNHARERAEQRMRECGYDPVKMLALANACARKVRTDTAVLLVTLRERVGQAWSDTSNGDQVWAIVRNGQVVTLMLRRSTQPRSPEAFGVDYVRTLSEVARG